VRLHFFSQLCIACDVSSRISESHDQCFCCIPPVCGASVTGFFLNRYGHVIFLLCMFIACLHARILLPHHQRSRLFSLVCSQFCTLCQHLSLPSRRTAYKPVYKNFNESHNKSTSCKMLLQRYFVRLNRARKPDRFGRLFLLNDEKKKKRYNKQQRGIDNDG